ncbi:MAG: protein kinase, partial [Oscillospiraceae bacterium]
MDRYIGKKLEGRYEILELIGFGGMAIVFKAFDRLENKNVAVKILKDEFLQNDDFKRRFRNESKAIALLSHPGIVKVSDVNFSDNVQYIVMEYIDGIT